MCQPLLLLILFCCRIYAMDFENNLEEFDEDMRNKEMELVEATRSHRASLEKIPFIQSDDSTCPSQCMERRGDGICDKACDTGACLHDYGDCDEFPSCSSYWCPCDECSWKCALSGCEMGTCQLSEEGQKEFFWARFPSINPKMLFHNFFKTELCLERQLGYSVILESDKAGPMIFGRRIIDKRLTRMRLHSLYNLTSDGAVDNSSLALFSIRSHSIVTMRDTHDIDRLRRMGTPSIKAKIIPFTLSKEERASFIENGLFTQRYHMGVRGYQEWAERRCTENQPGRTRRFVGDEEIDFF